MNITEEVGSRIRHQRKRRKLSQEQLAEKSDLHPSYIGQLERGEKTPTIDTLYRITKGMDLSLSDFLKDLEIVDKGGENYAVKSYILIEKITERDQRHIYEIIQHILSMRKGK